MVRRRPNTQAVRIAHPTLALDDLWRRVGDVWEQGYLACEFRLCHILRSQTRVANLMRDWQPEGYVTGRVAGSGSAGERDNEECPACAWVRFDARHCIEELRRARERVSWAGGDTATTPTRVLGVRPSAGFCLWEGVEDAG